MSQEEKEMLLKDLCARLPYGVKAKITDEDVLLYDSGIGVIVGKEHIDNEIFILQCKNDSWCLTAISEFVPYLRSMSSMTEEEKAFVYNGHIEFWVREDYCNKHFLDYRGLIPMGLALEAPEGMYQH